MMSSRSLETLIDTVLQRKMPLFNGTIAATGLSTPQNMSAFLGKQTLQYSGGYFSYDPSRKDGAGFTPSLLDGRSPVSHHSGMDGQNHIIYRQDSKSEEGHSYSPSQRHTPVKQGFTLYSKSPGVSSPTAATSVIVRKQKSGGESASPLTEKSVYLAIPKPIYGHNPCCNELGCVIGQRYSVEHGSPRISNPVYEHDWRQSEAHYTETLPIQRTAQETLVQQRGLQLEPGTEPLKRVAVETYSPGRARTLPGVVEPSYSSYPCTPTRTLFGSVSEQSQHLQTSPRAYPSLYPSHPTYEHMTSEIYQDRSPISKYGQLTQHPMFYYPQANVEVENRTQCKDISSKHREDVPVILKHAIPNSRDHYVLAQSLHGEISLPLSGTETLPNNSLLQGYDYPCYAVPRLHLNTSHIRSALKRPPAMHSNRLNVSPSIQHMDHPTVSSTIQHKEKSSDSLHAKQSHTSPLFLHMDQTSPTAPLRKSEASPPNVQINRFFPQLCAFHRDRPVLPPTSITIDSSCVTHVPCTKQPKGLPTSPVSPVAWLPHLPNHCSGPVHQAVANDAYLKQIIYSPATGKKTLSNSATGYPKETLKRSISHSSTPIIIKEEEDGDLCEEELSKKRQKMKDENGVGNKRDSPPMPVINNVFSLAPYKAYLQASGVSLSGTLPQRTEQSSEVCGDPPKPQQKQTKPEKVEQQPDVCLVSKENCPDNKTEKPVVEICELKNIKEEKLDPVDTDKLVQSSVGQDCVKGIKEEPDECGLSDCGPMLVIKKWEPDELENKPSLTNGNTASDEVKAVEVTAQKNTSSQGDECLQNEQVLDPPKPISPPPPPLNFKNIPPQCLKLSTYKIILPDSKLHDSVKIPPKPQPMQPVEPVAEVTQKTEVKVPVRKHFLELHHSLSKLISKSVSASSEQSLRAWLSQLELPEPASPITKFQKVTCLLGVKGREACLNEEIKSALNKVVERLREYTVQERCPFPHVMRTGAVFLPMLVVKELLFPMVQGSFIDQVLQEHKVELRPTTLSEEKILIQLHKRACSSRLRRLMSLKHLPDIYADVVNLLYYTTVCTHLGLNMDDSLNREPDEGSEGSSSCRSPGFSSVGALQASSSESHLQRGLEENGKRTKSRVKSSSRRMFLDSYLTDEEEQDSLKEIENKDVLNQSSTETQSGHQSEEVANSDSECVVVKQDGYINNPQSMMFDNSWTCPLTSDDVSSSDTEISDAQPSGSAKSPVKSKSCSGVILKLRRMFGGGLNRKRARYQAVSESGAFTDPSLSRAEDTEREGGKEGTGERRTPRVTHRWQRTGGFSPALRPLSASSKRKHRSLLKIKYCPYLSACHSAEHRRRWVLRSAVKRARRAMRFYYPDLVGKRIYHLYEENDKSEVWYSGEVLRIHEAHSNPLKTIFEVRYDSEPEWKYYLELLIDYKKGWLKIQD